ncbi:helix-turn-helix transcriptional regulator [Streptomyces sp. PT12]|uniref:helix-turn-helix domain-containing protein n=1 Tax=Streptomyces sp. PT12 TaxID=1510197 RepID=UPI0015EF0DD2|nr:helix-turn-helix transcriptional regulator [Streptomyces sp. PT12]
MTGKQAAEEFAARLRELKDRSGHSFGTLARRLHTSTSTLHRYCSGTVVPADYAPVERLARLCGATADELVELHRLWVRAEALRPVARQGGRAAAGATESAAPAPVAAPEPGPEPPPEPGPEPPAEPGPEPPAEPEALPPSGDGSAAATALDIGGPVSAPERSSWRSSRGPWWLLVAGVAVLAVLVATLVNATTSGGTHRDGTTVADGGTSGGAPAADGAPDEEPIPEASPEGDAPAEEGDEGDAHTPEGSSSESTTGNDTEAPPSDEPSRSPEAPLTWTARSHVWEGGCGHRYLVDRPAAEVPPPPIQQDAEPWAERLGAVHGGSTIVEATVRPSGDAPVVVESLHVRVTERSAPLDWPAFDMSLGCGGALTPAAFAVDLDEQRPIARPVDGFDGDSGQTLRNPGLPYSVTDDEPLALRVFASASACDCSWYVELVWSSGDERGTLRVDDDGRAFRTSGGGEGTVYSFPHETEKWTAE